MRTHLGHYRLHTAALRGFGRAAALTVTGAAVVTVALVAPSTSVPQPERTSASLASDTDDPYVPLDPTTAPAGEGPRTAYSLEGVLHFPDGSEVPIASEREIVDVASIGANAAVVHAEADGALSLEIYTPDGDVVETYAAIDGPLISNDDYSLLAFLSADGEPIVLGDGGETGALLPATPAVAPQLRALEGGTPSDAAVIVRDAEQSYTGNYLVRLDSVRPVPHDGAGEVMDLDAAGDDEYLYAVTTGYDEEQAYTTSGLMSWDFADIWMQDDYGVRSFAALGDVIEAGPTWSDGLGDGVVAFLDPATGAPVHEFIATEHLWITGTEWEDEDSLLVTLTNASLVTESVLRVGTDGSVERVVADAEFFVG